MTAADVGRSAVTAEGPGGAPSNGGRGGSARPGRRPGNPDTRATILAAAAAQFARSGFDKVSMRGIAKAAGVDPALGHHYFGSKDDVLLATLDMPFDPRVMIPELTQQGVAGLGARIALRFVSLWDEPDNQARLVAVLRACVSSAASVDLFRSGLIRMILTPIGEAVDAPDAQLRAQLVATQLMGLAMGRYVLLIEPLASAPAAEVVARLGPTLQRYLDGVSSPEG